MTTTTRRNRVRALWVFLLGVLLAAMSVAMPAHAQTPAPASNPLGPIPQRCPITGSPLCLGGESLDPSTLTESYLGGLVLSQHLLRVGQQVTASISDPAPLTTPCYGAPHCVTGYDWSFLSTLGVPSVPCATDYTATTCTVTVQNASPPPVAGQRNWDIASLEISGVPGSALDDDFYYVTSTPAISGIVLDSTGKPLVGAHVLIAGPGGSVAATVDPNTGFYYALNLAPGTYGVTATGSNGAPLTVTSCSGRTAGATCTDTITQQDGTANFQGGATTTLAFTVQPGSIGANVAITPPVQVAVEDSSGAVQTSATGTITLTLGTNPSAATLGGTLSAALVSGTASFSTLIVNKAGQGYTLVASDSDNTVTSVTSNPFTVNCGGTGPVCLSKDGQVTGQGGLSYTLTLSNPSPQPLNTVTVKDQVTPAFNVQKPTPAVGLPQASSVQWPARQGSTAKTGTIIWQNLTVPTSGPTTITYPLQPAQVTAADGARLSIPGWTTDGWVGTSATTPAISRTGGDLIFSDAPEFLQAGTTQTASGEPLTKDMEGILYKQMGITSAGTFRMYLNHENRTAVAKALYYVLTNPSRAPVTVTAGATGLAHDAGNPVAAGQHALEQYLGSGSGGTVTVPSGQSCAESGGTTTIPGGATCVFFVSELAAKGQFADVVNLIQDLDASGAVQAGVVVINVANEKAFATDPLGYHFDGVKDSQKRTYSTSRALQNPGEPHASGTFPYSEVDVTLPYDVSTGDRYGWRLGDCSAQLCANGQSSNQAFNLEYAPAKDDPQHPVYNVGNFGVLYKVTVQPQNAQDGMATQVLFNPRAVAPRQGTKTANAFAGVITTSTHAVPFAVPATGNVTDRDEAVGAGYITGNTPFTLELIPPAGDSLPVAIVLAPAYVKNTAQAQTSAGMSDPQVKILPLPNPNP